MQKSTSEFNLPLFDYPGGLQGDTWVFPEMISIDSKGKKHLWQIYVQLCRGTATHAAETIQSGQRPETIPITEAYFTTIQSTPSLPIYCRIWVKSGQYTIKNGAITLVSSGKNIGKSNATTVFKQAMMDAYSKYKAQLFNKEYDPESPHLHDGKPNGATEMIKERQSKHMLIRPMLPKKGEDPEIWMKKHEKEGPVYVQQKLNGCHMLATWYDRLHCYSRELTEYAPQIFESELTQLCKAYPTMTFDGEAYSHGRSLQEILSGMTDVKSNIPLTFFVFDVYDRAAPDRPYEARVDLLQKIFQTKFNYLSLLTSVPTASFTQVEIYFKQALKGGFEGLVLKLAKCPYVPQKNDTRPYYSIKYKAEYSSEFECIGYKTGQGKAEGLLATWRFRITQKSIDNAEVPLGKTLKLNAEFEATPAVTEEQKRQWLAEADMHLGRYATVKYNDVSNDGIPLQANMMAFRD